MNRLARDGFGIEASTSYKSHRQTFARYHITTPDSQPSDNNGIELHDLGVSSDFSTWNLNALSTPLASLSNLDHTITGLSTWPPHPLDNHTHSLPHQHGTLDRELKRKCRARPPRCYLASLARHVEFRSRWTISVLISARPEPGDRISSRTDRLRRVTTINSLCRIHIEARTREDILSLRHVENKHDLSDTININGNHLPRRTVERNEVGV